MKRPLHGILGHASHLVVAEIAGGVLLFLTWPYLARVFGPQPYGDYLLAQIVCQYAVLLTDFGFNLSATRSIALRRDQPEGLEQLSRDIFAAKALLVTISLAGLALAAIALAGRIPPAYVAAGCSAVFASLFFPVWLMQGLEKMRSLALLMLVARGAGFLLLIGLVRHEDQVTLALVLTNLPMIAAGLGWLVVSGWGRRLCAGPYSLTRAIAEIRSGFGVFASTVAYHFYTATNSLVLGLIGSAPALAFFNAAERLAAAAKALTNPFVQAAFPAVSRASTPEHREHDPLLRGLAYIICPLFLAISAVLYFASDLLIRLVFGAGFEPAAALLRILAPIPALLALAHVIVTLGLLAAGHRRHWIAVIQSTAILNFILLGGLLTVLPPAEAVAWTMLVDEAWVVAFGLFCLRRARRAQSSAAGT